MLFGWHLRHVEDKSIPSTRKATAVQSSGEAKVTLQPPLIISSPVVSYDQLEVGEVLGHGSFSSVYCLKSSLPGRQSSEYLALKQTSSIVRDCPDQLHKATDDLAFEAAILSQLQHDNIVQLHAVSHDFLDNMADRFLVLDRLQETLDKRLKRWSKERQPFVLGIRRPQSRDEQVARALEVGLPLAEALQYLHERNILHRDIKPANIGFDYQGRLKLFDFGLARFTTARGSLTDFAGTLRYMSPECYFGYPYSFSSDVYSYSMVLWEVLSLQALYGSINQETQMARLVFVNHCRPSLMPIRSRKLKRLLRDSWDPFADARPCFASVATQLQAITTKSNGAL